MDVGEVGAEWGDPAPGRRCQLGRVELIDDLEAAAIEDLRDQSTDDRFVGCGDGGHGRNVRPTTTMSELW